MTQLHCFCVIAILIFLCMTEVTSMSGTLRLFGTKKQKHQIKSELNIWACSQLSIVFSSFCKAGAQMKY